MRCPSLKLKGLEINTSKCVVGEQTISIPLDINKSSSPLRSRADSWDTPKPIKKEQEEMTKAKTSCDQKGQKKKEQCPSQWCNGCGLSGLLMPPMGVHCANQWLGFQETAPANPSKERVALYRQSQCAVYHISLSLKESFSRRAFNFTFKSPPPFYLLSQGQFSTFLQFYSLRRIMWLLYTYPIKLPPNWLFNMRSCISNILWFILLNKEVSTLCPESATRNFWIPTSQAQQNTSTEDRWTNP